MSYIIEKIKRPFNNKRISPKTIRELAGVILEVKNDLKKQKEKVRLTFSIDTKDGSYESESIQIFEENGLLDKKIIQRITMSIVPFESSSKIEIHLLNTLKNEEDENYIRVTGDDSIWVNGIVKKLEEIIFCCEPQPNQTTLLGWGLFIIIIFINVEFFRLFFK